MDFIELIGVGAQSFQIKINRCLTPINLYLISQGLSDAKVSASFSLKFSTSCGVASS